MLREPPSKRTLDTAPARAHNGGDLDFRLLPNPPTWTHRPQTRMDARPRLLMLNNLSAQVKRGKALAMSSSFRPSAGNRSFESAAPELSCMGSLLPASVPVVLFPLVPNRAHDDVVADDLEENDVARPSEWDDQFPGSAITKLGSTACIGRPRKQPHALADSIKRFLRTGPVRCPAGEFALNGEVLKAPEIIYRFLQQRDRVLERHRPVR